MASLKVAVRVRPFNKREKDMNAQSIVHMESNKTSLEKPRAVMSRDSNNEFTFDYSYDSTDHEAPNYVPQVQVYEDLGTDVIDCAYQGYNACVFAYGQTGSGKTFTMMGTSGEQGLIPRICRELFARMQLGGEKGIGYKTHVSYLEIYNEKVKDLLGSDENLGHSLKVREHKKTGPYVENLSQHPVTDYDEIQTCISKGNNIRTTASTNMNDTSSRSHAIFTITFVQADFRSDLPSETVSKIHLVDLAGSERANATGATGQRLKEGAHINKSLVTLGNVISALAEQANPLICNKRLTYVPYRDSVLTWLLKDSLGGNSKTIMIAAISPADCNYGETLSTLRYANRAKNIINKPTVNEDPNVRLIRELREEIMKLKSMIVTDSEDMEPKKVLEDLMKKEAQEKVLTEEWTEKWRQAQSILREEKSLGLRKSGFGIVLDSEMPHLIGIHDDTSTGVTLYSLKEGITLIGTADADIVQDIVLSGTDILPEHCSIVLENGNATIFPREMAQCFLNANELEDCAPISQGDILMLGRTNMFRYNNPTEAAKLRKDASSRSRLDLSRLSFIAASRENLVGSFYCDDDGVMTSPFKRSQLFESPLARDNIQHEKSRTGDSHLCEYSEEDNKKILETIENALGQLKFQRLQMHEHYKRRVEVLNTELDRLAKKDKHEMAWIDCKEKELKARKEMLMWERNNEKVQVDIVVRQLATLQSDHDKNVHSFCNFIVKELNNSKVKLDIEITESTPIEESSEILLVVSQSLDGYTAQYIKDTVKRSKTEISQIEFVLKEKRELLKESTDKLCDLDLQLRDIEKEAHNLVQQKKTQSEIDEMEMKKQSLKLPLNLQEQTNLIIVDTPLETFHTANSDCSMPTSPQSPQLVFTLDPGVASIAEKAMSDSGVCLESQKNMVLSLRNDSSDKVTDEDDDEEGSCFSCGNSREIPSYSEFNMIKLREKIAMLKAEIMKNFEREYNKNELDEQIEQLQELKLELERLRRTKEQNNDGCFSNADLHTSDDETSIADITEASHHQSRPFYTSTTNFHTANRDLAGSSFNVNLARSFPSISTPFQDSEHTISIPSFILRGAGKQTHYEYEIKINLIDGRWSLLRRYSRFRDLHLTMKSCYGQKIKQIYFPRREIFSSNSESVAKARRRQLEMYLRRLLQVCSKIPQSPVYEGNGDMRDLTKANLIQLSPFFIKGLFESGKHGTG